jgi:hypothetical protein
MADQTAWCCPLALTTVAVALAALQPILLTWYLQLFFDYRKKKFKRSCENHKTQVVSMFPILLQRIFYSNFSF